MIKGELISLVPLESEHLAKTLEWVNTPEIMRLLDRAKLVEPDEHRRWFESLREKDDVAYFAINTVCGGEHIGNVWLHAIEPRHGKAELRVLIGDLANTSKGMGSEAIAALCNHAFNALGLHKIYAYVLGINPRAKRGFEKAGFAVEGVLREDRRYGDAFTDVYLLGRIADSRTNSKTDCSVAGIQR